MMRFREISPVGTCSTRPHRVWRSLLLRRWNRLAYGPGVTALDDERFAALADPDTLAFLPVLPDLEPSLGISALRAAGKKALDDLGLLALPSGVTRTIGPTWRTFHPEEAAHDDRAILWIHGGGMIGGEPRQDDLLCADLALTHGVPVHATAYRLAPEHPYPAGLDDCVAALRRLLRDYPTVLVAGASAGGGLAIGTAMRARDEGLTGVRGVVAYYPMVDDRPGRSSMERLAMRKTWHHDMDRWAWSMYLPEGEVSAYATPARATTAQLRGLPPVALDIGALDGFFDENLALATALARADVPVDLTVTPGAFHASEKLAPDAPSSRRIVAARHAAYRRFLSC